MKFLAIVGFAAVLSQASCGHLKMRFQGWDEEGCHQAARIRKDETIKSGKCENFDVFRSFQVLKHKHTEKLGPECKVLVFDEADCRGRQLPYEYLRSMPGACQNATFPLEAGQHSGRSVKLVCDKPKPVVAAARSSTLVEIPLLVSTTLQTKTITQTKPVTVNIPASPSASSVVIVSPAVQIITKTVTGTPPKVAKSLLASSAKTSTKTILVSPSSKTPTTTATFCLTTAWKGARPTKRSEGEQEAC